MLAEAAKHPCNETLVFCAEKGTIMLYFIAIMQQHMHTPMCFTMENDTNTLCFTTKKVLGGKPNLQCFTTKKVTNTLCFTTKKVFGARYGR